MLTIGIKRFDKKYFYTNLNQKESTLNKNISFRNFTKSPMQECNQLSDILFFSGTFNPIHKAHVFIANDIKQKLGCSKVVLVPAFLPFHKKNTSNVTFKDKVEMAKLAVSELDGFEVSDIDKQANEGNSYSYNTVKKFIEELPLKNKEGKLNFLIGADAFAGLLKWFKVQDLSKLVKYIISTRFGEDSPEKIVEELKKEIPNLDYQIFNEDIQTEVSSSTVRELLKKGQPTGQYLDKKVANYIKEHKLYNCH